jgi:hypothetical protein
MADPLASKRSSDLLGGAVDLGGRGRDRCPLSVPVVWVGFCLRPIGEGRHDGLGRRERLEDWFSISC